LTDFGHCVDEAVLTNVAAGIGGHESRLRVKTDAELHAMFDVGHELLEKFLFFIVLLYLSGGLDFNEAVISVGEMSVLCEESESDFNEAEESEVEF
jgi:hypothetical protein